MGNGILDRFLAREAELSRERDEWKALAEDRRKELDKMFVSHCNWRDKAEKEERLADNYMRLYEACEEQRNGLRIGIVVMGIICVVLSLVLGKVW